MSGHPWPQVRAVIADLTGLHFPPERCGELQRGLAEAARELGLGSAEEYAQRMLATPPTRTQFQALVRQLTVGETYFFRDRRTFQTLTQIVLPDLVRRHSRDRCLRIWSAACCTGEEAYSIAILLREHLPQWRDWQISVLGTDINEQFLEKAATGEFGRWSFREGLPQRAERHFTPCGNDRLALDPEIRRMVRFAPLNLVAEDFRSRNDTQAVDLILCRNVLMYFTTDTARRVIHKLHGALAEDGWLVVSPSEGSHTLFSAFTSVACPSGALYRKSGRPLAAGTGSAEAQRLAAAPLRRPRPAPLPPRTESAREAIAAAPARETAPGPAPARSETFAARTRELANQGRLDDALACCDEWILAAKLDPAARYLRAMVLQERGDAPQAGRSLQHAVFLDPGFALAHFALGNLARAEDDPPRMRRHFANALRIVEGKHPDELLAESDGLTAGRLRQIITALLDPEAST